MKNTNDKIIIIALDGSTWYILNHLIKQGLMPNLDNLKENGAYGNLLSTIPPITAPAWASFITGKDVGNHGLNGHTQSSQFRIPS